jgi:hypothetical protein
MARDRMNLDLIGLFEMSLHNLGIIDDDLYKRNSNFLAPLLEYWDRRGKYEY